MARPAVRRLVAAIGAAALVTLGVGVVATPSASAATSATKTTDNIKVTKSVTPGTATRGATVTYTSVFEDTNAVDRYLNKITDVYPAGFQYVPGSAKITASGLVTGPSTSNVTPSVDAANNRLSVSGNWLLADRWLAENKDVTFEVSYTVPPTAQPGTYDSGLTFEVFSFQTTQVFDPIGVHVTVDVPNVATATTVQVPATATAGQQVNLTATVAPAPDGGTVQFKDGATDIGAPVAAAGGTATLPWTFTTAGTKSITAVYSGAVGFAGSTSAAATVKVGAPDATTSTTVQAPASSTTGQSVQLTATVAPAPSGGTVQFKDGTVNIGAPVALDEGVATLSHTFGVAGAKAVTAVYSGTTGFVGSTSQPVTVTVTDPAPGDVLTSTTVTVPGSVALGQAAELIATVAPAGATGTVQFKVGATSIGGPVAVVGGVAALSHTFSSSGEKAVTAVYSGGPGYVGSASPPAVVTVSGGGAGTGSLENIFGS
ncbi:Ig-like domain repeat protein [Rhodococcus gannanensis]|uniref:Ig-like domain repeat protein n=1 Tax=Rhodococcus gannanensis TaxID=1960308 RepID=A0ABW4PBH3_9NOCA